MANADALIDRNRRLLAVAEDTRALTRRVVSMSAASRSTLAATAWLWVDLQRTRCGLLADMVYLRHTLAGALPYRRTQAIAAPSKPCA